MASGIELVFDIRSLPTQIDLPKFALYVVFLESLSQELHFAHLRDGHLQSEISTTFSDATQ